MLFCLLYSLRIENKGTNAGSHVLCLYCQVNQEIFMLLESFIQNTLIWLSQSALIMFVAIKGNFGCLLPTIESKSIAIVSLNECRFHVYYIKFREQNKEVLLGSAHKPASFNQWEMIIVRLLYHILYLKNEKW